jgi:serine/threonine-protein kinase
VRVADAAALTAGSNLPRSFGPYTLFDFIGKGGMAEIFLARQRTNLGGARLCVVKQILPGLAGDATFSELLVHEAKLAARLSHGNVVQVFDLGREGERLFIAMEYVEGFDFNDLLRRCSQARVRFPFELGLHVVREALRGLDYAHRRVDDEGRPLGLVHRDVSPSNLLVSFEGEVKVCDFGIARATETVPAKSATAHELDEALRGKAGYMSPEHARGETIDARADVFAAGIVLWELAAGRRMYRTGDGQESLLELARAAQIPELPVQGLPEPERLRSILSKALAVERDSRYPSAASMLRDLESYAAGARLVTSPLQLGDWLAETFGADIIGRRRSRERAVAALEQGPAAVVQIVDGVASTRAVEILQPPARPAQVVRQPPSARGKRQVAVVAGLLVAVALALAVAAYAFHGSL